MITDNDIGLMTIAEAAEVAGVRASTVRSWISRYRLPTVPSMAGGVLVSERAVLDCEQARRRQPRGRRRVA